MTKLGDILAHNLITLRGNETQEAFAERLGISLRALQRYESGERPPKGKILDQISNKLRISSEDLFKNHKKTKTFAETISVSRLRTLLDRKLQSIPDKVFEIACNVPINDEVWDDVIDLLKDAEEKNAVNSANQS